MQLQWTTCNDQRNYAYQVAKRNSQDIPKKNFFKATILNTNSFVTQIILKIYLLKIMICSLQHTNFTDPKQIYFYTRYQNIKSRIKQSFLRTNKNKMDLLSIEQTFLKVQVTKNVHTFFSHFQQLSSLRLICLSKIKNWQDIFTGS